MLIRPPSSLPFRLGTSQRVRRGPCLALAARLLGVLGGASALSLISAASAAAQPARIDVDAASAAAQPARIDFDEMNRRALPPMPDFYLDTSPGISMGLEAYAGLGVLSAGGPTLGHALTGGLSRLRWGNLELGASFELSDSNVIRWRQFGGFVGAYLPVVYWVDFDASVGLVERRYLGEDTNYGPGGLDVGGPALTLRVGVADRAVPGRLGLRLGAALLAAMDLQRHQAPWAYEVDGELKGTGVSRIGGYSVGLAICLGFDATLKK